MSNESDKRISTPDGGWGWMVVVGGFFILLLHGGFLTAYTFIFTELRILFQSGAERLAWASSINNLCKFLLGPVTGSLVQHFGTRKLSVLGGFLYAAGIFLTGFAKTPEFSYISYGFLTGVGAACVSTSLYVAIAEYFHKKKALAMSIVFTGDSFGMIIYVFLIPKLLEEYAFKGTMMILAALLGNLCVSGMLFRPLEYNKPELKVETNDKESGDKKSEKNWKRDLKVTLKNYREIVTDFKKCSFIAYLFCICIGLAISQLFLSDLALDQGLTTKDASLAILISASLNIFIRILAGYLFDRAFIKKYREVYFSFIGIGYGISLVTLSFPVGRIYFYLNYALLMCFSCIHYSQYATVLTDGVDPKKYGEIIGLCRFTNGLGFVIGQAAGGK
ncbi:DgyrCDS8960 [Dimorphilus gyrociliatus]|uniref:DgyrCDS8960 n=1 Tax=Dimorphilus gyrociliatus TaxID=2664684 RepID=A0A7I8VX68_9ANNE|nr:DgyrCDS8960 [Dimorphilus gyrociliatus]